MVEDLIRKAYGKDYRKYLNSFQHDVEFGYEHNGCLQGVYCMERSVYGESVDYDKEKMKEWDKQNPYKQR